MFLWFVACGVLLVATVFDSPGIDYRFVAAGSALPLAENLTGSPWVLHTLAGGALLLTAVMVATSGRGKRLLRRRWLGLPIGALTFLVASGSWLRTELFWWPFAGIGGVGSGHPPELDRPLGLLAVLEAVGVLALVWTYRRFGLSDPERRRDLLVAGRLIPPRN